jgi:uncharacterized protein YbjT (DUF2867 family)
MKVLLLVGATGLVGQSVVQQALTDPRVARLVAPTRRPLHPQPRLENPVINFDALPAEAPWWSVDGVICTLGSTIKKAGSQPAFRKVDHDYPLAVATFARRRGAAACAFTSSIGADPRSRAFYLRTKGETERALGDLRFPSLTIVRPSFIGGARGERRPLESLALALFGSIARLLPRRNRVVPAERIARVLLEAALAAEPGVRIVESQAI